MNNFLDYANYYDLLYHDKNYQAEVVILRIFYSVKLLMGLNQF